MPWFRTPESQSEQMKAGASVKREFQQPGLLSEKSNALREHAAVQDAAVYRQADGTTVAFIVPREKYIDEVLGRREAAGKQVRKWQKTYDLTQLAKSAAASPFAFNIAGWNSSYTRQPLPAEDMKEWVETTVERISTLEPSEVLEIGCGTGLLLLRLAPRCKRYVAMDFAPSVLIRLREQLAQAPALNQKVELLERSADNFDGLQENGFSTVIVNSVAQHFPSQTYLNRVMDNAIRVVRPGGKIFIGDQRNLLLHRACAASVEAFQAAPETTVAELRTRIDGRLHQELQLVLSPTYFLALKQRYPKVSRVEIYPRRGNRDNEMTRFRFDAILGIGGDPSKQGVAFLAPPADGWHLNAMRAALAGQQSVGFARIRNARLEPDMRLLDQLSHAPERPISTLRQELHPQPAHGIHPEELFRLAAETGYEVAISGAACYEDGSYDAAFFRGEPNMFPAIPWPQAENKAFVYLSNAPGQTEIREKLARELLSDWQQQSSGDASVRFYFVDSLPCKSDGSIDQEALFSATAST